MTFVKDINEPFWFQVEYGFNDFEGNVKGYIEEGFGIVDLPLLTGRGFCKVLLADENARIDIVPVDIVANMHIVAAWSVGTKRMPSMSIINCTAGPWFLTYGSYIETWKKLYSQFLLPKSFQKLSLSVAKNIYVYKLLVLYEHYLPAYVLDLIFSLQKSKVRLVKFYKLLDEQAYAFHFFTTTVFDFEMGNFITVEEQLDSRDKEMFSLRRDDIDIIKLHEEIPNGCPYYDWKVADTLTPEERKVKVIRTVQSFLASRQVQLLPWPAYSLDISPIEHVWDFSGRRLTRDHRPVASTDELWVRIQTI
ncbi:fatty acyl-CoA reductase 1 [Parasteatoda tepidariorum]|uniref:fatty acyl-CoA reductase 1 n=1 Tax=Parasteatoda tepidariorum TaxID=114398 RepID=UPI0039BCB18F